MARNWVLLTVLGFVIGGGLLLGGWWAYHSYFLTPSEVPRWKNQTLRQRIMRWRTRNAQGEYELVDVHVYYAESCGVWLVETASGLRGCTHGCSIGGCHLRGTAATWLVCEPLR